ncbi:MAG: indole-3-glycerol phosphate synthase TrpC [Candidatus Kryptoniota bacterium]
MNFLETIINRKKSVVEEAKTVLTLAELQSLVEDIQPRRDFSKAITADDGSDWQLKVIAEIKRASPSKGVIVSDIDPATVARDYEEGGAAAISVLTETDFFKGSYKDFQSARDAVKLPVLRKDFIVDEYQIYESLLIGADSILLIAAALTDFHLENFISIAKSKSLPALVEVHSREELARAIDAGAEIIGVNSRDLMTFKVSRELGEKLVGMIPRDVIKVYESGIDHPHVLSYIMSLGYDAVLIGEHFMRARDRVSEVRKFVSRNI